jgi:HemY protein
VSPVSGRLDAFEWRVPLTGILSAPVIEPEPSAVAPIAIASEQHRASEEAPAAPEQRAAPVELAAADEPAAAVRPVRRRDKRKPAKREPVIPLVHAPDDPGPEAVDETEPPPEPQTGGWKKLFE